MVRATNPGLVKVFVDQHTPLRPAGTREDIGRRRISASDLFGSAYA
jgi:hypothetical protein